MRPGFADGSLLLRLDTRRHLLDALVARLDEHVSDRGCDDILLLLVTMR